MLHVRTAMVWLGVVILGAGGCGSTEPRLVPVTGPDQRFEAMSVITPPPEGDRWYVAEHHDKERATLLFNLKPPEEDLRNHTSRTVLVMLQVERIDPARRAKLPTAHDVLEDWRDQLTKDTAPRIRRVSLTTSYEPFEGGESLRFVQKAEERDNPQFPGKVLTTDYEGFVCIHPQNPGLTVSVITSQREPAELPDPSIKPLHDAFVRSMKFEKAKSGS